MSVAAFGIYSETLQSIINAKLEELVRKRDAFEGSKASLIKYVEHETEGSAQLKVLVDGVLRCLKLTRGPNGNIIGTSQTCQTLRHIERFLEQPRYDPSVSKSLLSEWKTTLLQQLEVQSSRYEYASLYARLVTEWLSSKKGMMTAAAPEDLEMSDEFEELESAAKLETRQAWEKSVFTSFDTDEVQIKGFLSALFGEGVSAKKATTKALYELRQSVRNFEAVLSSSGHFNHQVLRWCINGLLGGELLSNEKRNVLKDFLNNDVILSELADVLNLRMSNIDEWSWGEVIPVEQQRRMAGHYSVTMNEDLLQAIFLQYIGVKWGVFFKNTFIQFTKAEEAWKPDLMDITTVDKLRLRFYLGKDSRSGPSLHARRQRAWKRYFMIQLPRHENEDSIYNDGDEEADYGAPDRKKRKAVNQQVAPMQMQQVQAPTRIVQRARQSTGGKAPRKQLASYAARKSAPSGPMQSYSDESSGDEDEEDEEDGSDHDLNVTKNMMVLKQDLLYHLRAEVIINTGLYDEFTAVRGQYESWNSLLPHSTIITVLTYLGVSPKWLKFFVKFLQAPLGFISDGTIETPRQRKRGVPGSHPLSDVFGEVVLFCLDLAVNQQCQGARLWRIYDDLWFWHHDHNVAVKAWDTIANFNQLMGLVLDQDKGGAARIRRGNQKVVPPHDSLPKHPIRWGFLYLDAVTGQFEINQEMVDEHVAELKRQLAEKESEGILSWTQAWNAYASSFFTTNFGGMRPALSFGRLHIDKILAMFESVQRKIFDDSNVAEYLRSVLESRHNVKDIPEGYYFFPTELGGLQLHNPFIDLLQLSAVLPSSATSRSETSSQDPARIMEEFFASEQTAYEASKKRFEKGQIGSRYRPGPASGWQPDEHEEKNFLSFGEYTRFREALGFKFQDDDRNLADVFGLLTSQPWGVSLELTPDISSALQQMDRSGVIANCDNINGNWHTMTAYWKWVVALYGPGIVRKFGGLNIVDNGVLPIGMVSLFRGARVEWKG